MVYKTDLSILCFQRGSPIATAGGRFVALHKEPARRGHGHRSRLGHRHRLGLERGPASVERRSASWAMEFAERIQGTEKESYKLPRREKPPQLNMVLGKFGRTTTT